LFDLNIFIVTFVQQWGWNRID